MKIMVSTTGILENVQWLMGYESMAFAQFDDPELIDAMFEKVGNAMSNVFYNASDFSSVGLFAMGDDMGFNSGTLFSPDFLRQHVFPLQKKCVDFGHDKNIPFILHSCGNLETVIDDIIDFVGIDAKHSFEDKIMPIEIAKEKYIDRVTLVGGVDVDFLVRSSEDEVRQRVLNILQSCDTKGGYIMGSGNSIANYIPIKNYYAMMDETAKFML